MKVRFLILASMALVATLARAGQPPLNIEELIDSMSPRERLTQLLFVGFNGTQVNGEVRRLVADWRVGAIALYARNITSAGQVRTLTSQIRELSGSRVPPLIAVDQEGGEVARMTDGVPQLPGQMALGATGSQELARRAGRALGTTLRALGVTMNLAPVLDLAEDPHSPIGIRAYAADPDLAGRLGAAFINGQRTGGVASVGKHFPGIGGTAADSHDTLPAIELRRANLAPFRAAVGAGVDALMVGHVSVPSVDGDTPATLSPAVIRLAREELHFDGVIITDVIEMHALDKSAGVGRLAVRSILAGADLVMVLWHERDREEVLAALEAAWRSEELSDVRIRASLRRILRVKLAALREQKGIDHAVANHDVADDIANTSITLLRNRDNVIPLTAARMSRERIAYLGPPGPISSVVKATRSLTLPAYITPEGIALWRGKARAAVEGATLVVAVAQNDAQLATIRAAHEANPQARVILISTGSPQLIVSLPDAAAYLCAYGYLLPSQRAVAAVLSGRMAAKGRLPVDIPGFTTRKERR